MKTWVNCIIRDMTPEEIKEMEEMEEMQAQFPPAPPDPMEQMNAQLFYTAMMTDTLMEV